jgi:hypothetical protein
MAKPATRTWQFFGRVFSDEPSINATISFNNQVIFSGEIPTDFSLNDYEHNWDSLWEEPTDSKEYINKNYKLFCHVDLDYSLSGMIPLKIVVNSNGTLLYTATLCNYSASQHWRTEDSGLLFTSSCEYDIDNRRNIVGNTTEIVEVSQSGWGYHINKVIEFNCDIYSEQKYITWLPPSEAAKFFESHRKHK